MNILYLAHRLPFPPDKGCKLRAFRQLERLARDHNVWCACFVDTPDDERHVAALAQHCHRLEVVRLSPFAALLRGLGGLATGGTLTESYYRHAGMTRVLNRWSQQVRFDAVVAFSSAMAPYAMDVSAPRHVVDLCDLDSVKWLDYAAVSPWGLRQLYRTEGVRLAWRERAWLGTFDATLLVTEAEARPMTREKGCEKLHVVRNGVVLPDLNGATDAPGDHPVVGFVGVMDYKPNIDAVKWFVATCWQSIRREFPDAEFQIVGRRPVRAVRRLARVEGVTVVGEVADAIKATRAFDVSVAPLRIARGLQNKVLEAMACAKPVVLTSGAAIGIPAANGRAYLIADEPVDFVQRVVSVLKSPSHGRLIGSAARAFVSLNYRWSPVLDLYEGIVTGLLADRSQRRDQLALPVNSTVSLPSHSTFV